jgi:hypothetical protein
MLPARDVGLHQGSPAVSHGPPQAHAAALGDGAQVPVPLRRRGLGILARHRARARWDDDVHIRMPRRDLGVDLVRVECPVGGEGRGRTADPVQQGTDLRAVVGRTIVSTEATIQPHPISGRPLPRFMHHGQAMAFEVPLAAAITPAGFA